MATPARPAERYGDTPSDPARTRRRLMWAFVAFVVLVVALAAWVAVDRSRSALTVTPLGVNAPDPTSATITFQVDMPPNSEAVCTVTANNASLVQVGRQDVTVRTGTQSAVRTSVTIRTSEQATSGGVTDCVRR